LNYILQNFAFAVYHSLQPAQLLSSDVPQTKHSTTWDHVFTEAAKAKCTLLQRISLAKTQEELTIIIQTSEINIVDLCNTLEAYVTGMKVFTASETDAEVCRNNYRALQFSLIELLLFMQQHFHDHFDNSQTVPTAYRIYFFCKHSSSIKNTTALLQQKCYDENLRQMLLATIHRFREEANTVFSFSQFNWFKKFIDHIERLNKKYAGEDLTRSITCALLHLNYNKPSFIDHVIEKLQSRINRCDTIHEQIQLWNRYLSQVKMLHECKPLCMNRPSVKVLLAQKIKRNITLLEKEIKAQHINSVSSQTNLQYNPITTGMSVSQLAVMVRLMVDTGIIQYKNHSDLIKKIATTFQTPKVSVISAESLRTKYYSPDRASLEMVKDYLFKMMGLMRDIEEGGRRKEKGGRWRAKGMQVAGCK